MNTFCEAYFHLCLELEMETWNHANMKYLGVMTLTTLNHLWAFNCQGSPTSKCSFWPKTAYSTRNGAPTRFVLTRWELVQPVLTKAILQLAKAAAMYTASLKYAHPPPPIPPLLLAQNLSSKHIVPTDIQDVAKVRQCQMASSVVKVLFKQQQKFAMLQIRCLRHNLLILLTTSVSYFFCIVEYMVKNFVPII